MEPLVNSVPPTFNFHFSPDKDEPSYGLNIAQWIDNWIRSGYGSYFDNRNSTMQMNRLWAAGKQPMDQFIDMLKIDAKNSFINIDFTPPAIMPKYITQIIELFMDVEQYPEATTTDTRSNKRKMKEKRMAEFRMKNQQTIQSIEKAAGLNLEDHDKFTPFDADELNLYFGTQYRLPEESIIEKLVKTVFEENDFYGEIKRLVIHDLCETGLADVRVTRNEAGKIIINREEPEKHFYGYSKYPDFRDCPFIGQLHDMKVPEFRRRFGKESLGDKGLDEKEIFDLCSKYGSVYPKQNLSWKADYITSAFRPYDEYTMPVLHFEIKTNNIVYSKKKTTKSGNTIIDFSIKKPNNTGENTKVNARDVETIYSGWYLRDSSIMLDWGNSKYNIRPSDNLSRQYFTYSSYMYTGFEMRNVAVPQKIRSSVFQMILCHLKIQQLMAKMKPAGNLYDIYGLTKINIGNGKVLSPLDMVSFVQQTGDAYWNSMGADGERRLSPPITPMPNSEAIPQLKGLIEIYNFYLSRLQDDLGTNPSASGAVNPRMGKAVMERQVSIATRGVGDIFNGWCTIADEVANKVAIMLWDDIIYDVSTYKEFIDPSLKMDKEITFSVRLKTMPSQEEKTYIEEMIQAAIKSGIIDFGNAFKIRNIAKTNIKMAELFITNMEKKKKNENMKTTMMNIQLNQQIQQQSAMMKGKIKEQEEMAKAKGKLINNDMQDEATKQRLLQTFIQQALLQSMKTGNDLDDYTKGIIQKYFQNNIESLTQNPHGDEDISGLIGNNKNQGISDNIQQNEPNSIMKQQ